MGDRHTTGDLRDTRARPDSKADIYTECHRTT